MPQAVWPLRSEYSLSQRPSGLSLLGAAAQPVGACVFWARSVLSGGPTAMLDVWLEFSWSAGVSRGGEVIAKPAQQLSLKFLFLCSVAKTLQWILGAKWTGEGKGSFFRGLLRFYFLPTEMLGGWEQTCRRASGVGVGVVPDMRKL